ncbi:MAG: hydantoinase/oxoprolinase family protein, partial [Pseudomonadota bacterium]|nr:hydantoinase/oxoprolinase family protein [Pseudomonadota bacterium]
DTLAELRTEATDFVRSCDANAPIEAEYKVYMRYRGQGWEIPVILTAQQAASPDMETFKALFEADYTTLFGRTVAGLEIEATVWAVNASTPTPPVETLPSLTAAAGSSADGAGTGATRDIFDAALRQTVRAAVVPRDALATGDRLAGPAAIFEDETTVIVPTSRRATIQPDGCIDLTAEEEG